MKTIVHCLSAAALLVPLASSGASAQRQAQPQRQAAPQRAAMAGALGGVELGQWQLKDAEGSVRRICVRDRAMLLRLMHAGAQCEQVVMESAPSMMTVRYSCPAHGHGRTTLNVETPRLVSIDTSGIADGAPFAEQFEARKTGTCD